MLRLMNGTELIKTVAPGGQFSLPNGDVVSPAYAGWSHGPYSLVSYTPPPEPPPSAQQLRQDMQLSFAQLLIGLVTEGWITQTEGRNWLAGNLPSAVSAMIDAMPTAQQFVAYARAVSPSVVNRLDPIVVAMGQMQGKTDEELDVFFQTYSVV